MSVTANGILMAKPPFPKITAVAIRGGKRYEKDLAQHFKMVAFWNIFPYWNAPDAMYVAWANRVIPLEGQ
jgi:hypothetical protein